MKDIMKVKGLFQRWSLYHEPLLDHCSKTVIKCYCAFSDRPLFCIFMSIVCMNNIFYTWLDFFNAYTMRCLRFVNLHVTRPPNSVLQNATSFQNYFRTTEVSKQRNNYGEQCKFICCLIWVIELCRSR
jgi:hypothetical protein